MGFVNQTLQYIRMVEIGEKVIVVRPFCTRFGLTGYVRMIDDGFIYIDYDQESIKIIKELDGNTKNLTGEAFSPNFIESYVSFIREQKLIILGI
jgi:hypothetical protein